MNSAKKYLDLICDHLKEHRAAVLVGAGFSKNATKLNPSLPSSPSWDELTDIFIDKLSSKGNEEEKNKLKQTDPLALAEQVKEMYGRPELDRILIDNIRDDDYAPSSIHTNLLRLPWTDIFTTNYDTLLERAIKEVPEKRFKLVVNQDDLIGSANETRIIKLHGSFPDTRPFIITEEDYRTYPKRFAPFVNTVQQSLLENTLCLIGFSGSDPNFKKWIGWIHDNFGIENSPNIYLLQHESLPETEALYFQRKRIIPVDLSTLTNKTDPAEIYAYAIEHLIEEVSKSSKETWEASLFLRDKSGNLFPAEQALQLIRGVRTSYPGWLTIPPKKLSNLRSAHLQTLNILRKYCRGTINDAPSSFDLELLFEYDWLRRKALLPIDQEISCYHQILERHPEDHSEYTSEIQLSLLQYYREQAHWTEWDNFYNELVVNRQRITNDQYQHLCWENALHFMAKYNFAEFKSSLENWQPSLNMPVWCLRKAGLLAEYGNYNEAKALLNTALLKLREQLGHQPNSPYLNSIESAMMTLRKALKLVFDPASASNTLVPIEEESEYDKLIDERHKDLHAQLEAAWQDVNKALQADLSSNYRPINSSNKRYHFEFNRISIQTIFSDNEDFKNAFTFLHFYEETGIPFFLQGQSISRKSACRAAERISQYAPALSILTMVRANYPSYIEHVLTRSVLSALPVDECDQLADFYLNALDHTNDELAPKDAYLQDRFSRLSAKSLPWVLAYLCTKCSASMLDKIFDLAITLYSSPNKKCYFEYDDILFKMLFSAYHPSKRQGLVIKLLDLPHITDHELESPDGYFNIFNSLPNYFEDTIENTEKPNIKIERLLSDYEQSDYKDSILDRLLYCSQFNLLSEDERTRISAIIWKNNQPHLPGLWLPTKCLEFPRPQNVDPIQYLTTSITEDIVNDFEFQGISSSTLNDLKELDNLVLSQKNALSQDQMTRIVSSFSKQVSYLLKASQNESKNFNIPYLANHQLYQILNSIWLLLLRNDFSTFTFESRTQIENIINKTKQHSFFHFGLHYTWSQINKNKFDGATELILSLYSSDEETAQTSYRCLAMALRNPQRFTLSEKELTTVFSAISQKISWCAPMQLDFALQVIKLAFEESPDLITENDIQLLLIGLDKLLEQTIILPEDSTDNAAEKGSLRQNAASLAKAMKKNNIVNEQPEILDKWMAVIKDPNEFAEIRNA